MRDWCKECDKNCVIVTQSNWYWERKRIRKRARVREAGKTGWWRRYSSKMDCNSHYTWRKASTWFASCCHAFILLLPVTYLCLDLVACSVERSPAIINNDSCYRRTEITIETVTLSNIAFWVAASTPSQNFTLIRIPGLTNVEGPQQCFHSSREKNIGYIFNHFYFQAQHNTTFLIQLAKQSRAQQTLSKYSSTDEMFWNPSTWKII